MLEYKMEDKKYYDEEYYRCPPNQSNYNQDDDDGESKGLWRTIIVLAVAATALITVFYCIIDPKAPPSVIKKTKEKQNTTIENKHQTPIQEQPGNNILHDSTIPKTIRGRTTSRIKTPIISHDSSKDTTTHQNISPPTIIGNNDSLVPVATYSPCIPHADTDSLWH